MYPPDILGLMFGIPAALPVNYLTISLKKIGYAFDCDYLVLVWDLTFSDFLPSKRISSQSPRRWLGELSLLLESTRYQKW